MFQNGLFCNVNLKECKDHHIIFGIASLLFALVSLLKSFICLFLSFLTCHPLLHSDRLHTTDVLLHQKHRLLAKTIEPLQTFQISSV